MSIKTRGHCHQYLVRHSRTSLSDIVFPAAIHHWNTLPASVVDSRLPKQLQDLLSGSRTNLMMMFYPVLTMHLYKSFIMMHLHQVLKSDNTYSWKTVTV